MGAQLFFAQFLGIGFFRTLVIRVRYCLLCHYALVHDSIYMDKNNPMVIAALTHNYIHVIFFDI